MVQSIVTDIEKNVESDTGKDLKKSPSTAPLFRYLRK